MKKCHKNNLVWYEFDLLRDFKEVAHAVFTRLGGVSKSPFEGLNVSKRVGDLEKAVLANREMIRKNFDLSSLVMISLEHRDRILEVSKVPLGDVVLKGKADALLTKEINIGLCMSHADCQAVIFYDPQCKMIANVHCGWRGNVINIFQKIVKAFKEKGSRVEDIRVCVSPSLGPEFSQFINYKKELPESFLAFQEKPCYFNLWDVSYHQLKALGIKPDHIEIAKMCSYSMEEEFYSYRRDHITGRNATVVALMN